MSKQAPFQSEYRKSSNFDSTSPNPDLEINKDGRLKLSEESGSLDETDKERIADAMDNMRERIEQTPGGEQSDA
ncbi:hypothetical protein [Croceiramulus getboli]|nr:hypothetical protein P8624_12030 [Flavobacteriaceae bacterium YJPT1-3]